MAGIKGRSGRKKTIRAETLAQLLELGWPMSERMAVIEKLTEDAKAGNLKATQILLAYTYGKPIERHELTAKDGGDLFLGQGKGVLEPGLAGQFPR